MLKCIKIKTLLKSIKLNLRNLNKTKYINLFNKIKYTN